MGPVPAGAMLISIKVLTRRFIQHGVPARRFFQVDRELVVVADRAST